MNGDADYSRFVSRHVYMHLALIELSHRGREKDIIVSPKTLWEHYNYHSY